MANFDLNFPILNNINTPFDLNNSPINNDDHSLHIEDVEEESDSSQAIGEESHNEDQRISDGEEYNSHVFELDLNQPYDENHDEDSGLNDYEEIPDNTRTNLSNSERWDIYNALLERSVNGKLKKTTTREVSELFSINIRTIQRIWKQAKNTAAGVSIDVSQRKKRCGRKKVAIDLERIIDTPLHRRTTLRTLGEALGVSHSLVHRRVKEGLIRRHSNALKPHLKEDNKVARLRFCLSMLDPHSLIHEPKFVDMYNIVHIDEKWFYMTKKSERYYLLPHEDDPVRTCQSKNFIGKVMFLVAMARPRFNEAKEEIFSGKIGVFPFVTMQPAQRRSKNREVGTMEMKPMISIKRDDIRRCLIEEVIPNIRRKWPREDVGKTIFIQQDNARTHVDPNDEEFRLVARQNGFDIRLMCQPPNSPDLNVLDLGFFSAIQSLQHKVCQKKR